MQQSHVRTKSDAFAGTAKGISRYLKILRESCFRYRKISKCDKGSRTRKGAWVLLKWVLGSMIDQTSVPPLIWQNATVCIFK